MYETLTKALGCPCTCFEPMKGEGLMGNGVKTIMKAYQEARVRGAKEGFTPLLIAAEESPLEELLDESLPEKYRLNREKLLAEPVLDARELLDQRTAQLKEEAEADGYEWPYPELLGEMEGGEAAHEFTGILDYGRPRKTIPLILAEIPVKNPWEVFAWVPFGGWNECPANEEQMAAAKYWFEKHGAVPAVITRDVLEYDLPAPVKREDAIALAMEQFTFCPDIVEQGCGSIGMLADILWKSTKWFFWWD